MDCNLTPSFPFVNSFLVAIAVVVLIGANFETLEMKLVKLRFRLILFLLIVTATVITVEPHCV